MHIFFVVTGFLNENNIEKEKNEPAVDDLQTICLLHVILTLKN